MKGKAHPLLLVGILIVIMIVAGIIPLGSLVMQGCGQSDGTCFDTLYGGVPPDNWNGVMEIKYTCTGATQSGHAVSIGLWNWQSLSFTNFNAAGIHCGDAATGELCSGTLSVPEGYLYYQFPDGVRVRMFETGPGDPALARSCKLNEQPIFLTDVPGPVCGDGVCDVSEEDWCSADCNVITEPVCGNGICETGETSLTCSADCAPEPPQPDILGIIQGMWNSLIDWIRGILGI